MKFNKPKFWDNNKINFLSCLLFPFSVIVNLINQYKFKYSKMEKFSIPIISVGNIYLGGTGKTPVCIEIFNILSNLKFNPAFVKKYYKQFTDENKLLESKGRVFLNKKRSTAINLLINNKFDVAILDDGFQDASIKNDISIVCFKEEQWIGNGLVIPSGPLREKLTALKRCNFVFINGNKNLEIERILNQFNSKAKIFYTQYKPVNLKNIMNKKVIAFAGIGNPKGFFDLIRKNNIEIVKEVNFPDHHDFTKNDILNLNKEANKHKACLVTTEKDYFRLKYEYKKNVSYLKIELLIDKREELIEELKKIL